MPVRRLKLVGDISCFRTAEGWLYLATVLDLCTWELAGYALAGHMRASLAVDAISRAHGSGLVAGNAIMHTDRGSQYHARAYRRALERLDTRQSTGRTGSCLDGGRGRVVLCDDEGGDRHRCVAEPRQCSPRYRKLDHRIQPPAYSLSYRLSSPNIYASRLGAPHGNGYIS